MEMIERVLILSALMASSAFAGEADVIDVKVTAESSDTYTFDVTVKHADAGWSHYADKWDVTGPNGEVYATRVLAHPHDDEQPFTRSQNGVAVPPGIKQVTIRAHDLIHAYSGKEMAVDLPDR
jgi:hypothetical protein